LGKQRKEKKQRSRKKPNTGEEEKKREFLPKGPPEKKKKSYAAEKNERGAPLSETREGRGPGSSEHRTRKNGRASEIAKIAPADERLVSSKKDWLVEGGNRSRHRRVNFSRE